MRDSMGYKQDSKTKKKLYSPQVKLTCTVDAETSGSLNTTDYGSIAKNNNLNNTHDHESLNCLEK